MIIINFWAVLAVAIAQFMLGWLWYGPLFGRAWLRLMGKTKAEVMQSNPALAMLGSFVPSLIMAYILAHFVQYAGAVSWSQGMQAGFWAWLGFIATTTLNSVLFEGKSKALYILGNGYYLVSLLIMGAILAIWR